MFTCFGITILLLATLIQAQHIQWLNEFDEVEKLFQNPKKSLIFFTAQDCDECATVTTALHDLFDHYSIQSKTTNFYKFDGTKFVEEVKKFKVAKLPTLAIFDSKQVFVYEGKYIMPEIKKFWEKDHVAPSMKIKEDPSPVVILSKSNFSSYVNSQPIMLVEFFAPWCGHCKQLAPEYEKAAKQLAKEQPAIPLATVDATVERELGEAYGVEGYPTLKVFRRGKASEFKGGRTADSIVSTMKEASSFSPTTISSVKDLDKFYKGKNLFLLALYSNKENSFLDTYKEVAIEFRYLFEALQSSSADLVKHFNGKSDQLLIIQPQRFHSEYESKIKTLDFEELKLKSASELVELIKSNALPLLGQYTPELASYYDNVQDKPLCLFFYLVNFDKDFAVQTQLWRKKILKVIQPFKKSINFAIADESDWPNLLKDARLDDAGVDMNVVCYQKTNGVKRRFVMEAMDEFDSDHIEEFLNNFLSGQVKPVLKSGIPPKRATAGPVQVIVSSNLESTVFDGKHHSVVYFHDKSCTDCPPMEDDVETAAKQLLPKDSKKLLKFYKFELSENDVPDAFSLDKKQIITVVKNGNRKTMFHLNQHEITGSQDIGNFIRNKLAEKEEL